MSRRILSRRAVLRGVGATIALPWLEAMTSSIGRAATAAKKSGPPIRMGFFYVPNGVNMGAWTPSKDGRDFELGGILESLKPVRDDVLVLTGLAQDKARPHGDGGGDHARSLASFLTGTQAFKTDGSNIRAGVSVDQVAAEEIGRYTRFPSLELGCDRGPQSGNCDSGYSCVYSANISWRSATSPLAKEINPRLVFERLFADRLGGGGRAKRDEYRLSILDFVREDASRLKNRLGQNDQRKLDEYMTSIRELEGWIARTDPTNREFKLPEGPRPTGIPNDYKEHIRLMFDLISLAYQADLTRITTFMFANEGSNRGYGFLGVPEGHHDLSHHGNDEEKLAKIRKINTFHMEQFSYFLEKLKNAREGDGSVLDRCMLVYGSGIGDGNRHNHDDLPILLAGGGAGTVKPGRHVKYKPETPLNNLYLSILDRVGVECKSLGDSTGRLDSLEG